jgi:hypothetical protein
MHHHGIVLKVWEADEDSARSLALCELEDSITPEHNTVGWDYLSGDHPTIITKGDLQAVYSVKTYAELEQLKLREQKESLDDLVKDLRDDILPMLAPIFMTKTDAALFINTENDELTAYIEKLMKRKKDNVKPATFEGITDAVLKIMVSVAKKDTGRSMAMWRMEKIKQVQACILYPTDTSYTLQCTENHYAELPCDNKKGMSPYFYFADRHF